MSSLRGALQSGNRRCHPSRRIQDRDPVLLVRCVQALGRASDRDVTVHADGATAPTQTFAPRPLHPIRRLQAGPGRTASPDGLGLTLAQIPRAFLDPGVLSRGAEPPQIIGQDRFGGDR